MALWGSVDQANSAPKSAPAQIRVAANTTTRTALYGNTTTTGVFGVSAAEAPANDGVTHPGWVLRTVGTGGRAGRVFNETLVAMGSITTDGDANALKDVTITFKTQPTNKTIIGANATSFGATAITSPNTAMVYAWKANTGAGFVALTDAGVYSNTATSVLSIASGVGLNGAQYRLDVSATGANTKTSKAATLTVN